MRKTQFAQSDKPVGLYSLDVIISVGYRVRSLRGIAFRKWANKVLKDYLVQGYAVKHPWLWIVIILGTIVLIALAFFPRKHDQKKSVKARKKLSKRATLFLILIIYSYDFQRS